MSSASSNKSSWPNINWHWFESLCIALLAIVGMDLFVGFLMLLLGDVYPPLGSDSYDMSIIGNFLLYVISRGLGLGLLVLFIRRRGGGLQSLGFQKFRIATVAGAILLATAVTVVALYALFIAIESLAPGVNLDQQQDIIFTAANGHLELILAFISLVVVAPIVEEALFRGFMFPGFAKSFGILPAAFLTSLLFGAVHGQLNVAIVTFVMGMVLCWLYYKTRSLWPAILFHSIKNGIAFISIFYETLRTIF